VALTPSRAPAQAGLVRSTVDIVILTYPGVQVLDVAGPHEVFDGANRVVTERTGGEPPYRLHVVSIAGGPITSESGLALATTRFDDHTVEPGATSWLMVPGGTGVHAAAADPALLRAARTVGERADRIITVCSGTFVAAAAGLIDGKRVTTHWARARRLAAEHPHLDVDPDPIHVRDGRVWSSAGVTSGIDLALALVEHDHGAEVAQTIARWLVMFLRRPGGQSQFAAPVWTGRAVVGPIRTAQDAIDADPGGDHRVGRLAERVGLSERHFLRRFTAEVGVTPAQYVIDVRVAAARTELERTSDTVHTIARQCGFGTAETLRRTFHDRLGVSPDAYRRRFATSSPRLRSHPHPHPHP
jgi:transcriptional regulator GlxA family with amidase domain